MLYWSSTFRFPFRCLEVVSLFVFEDCSGLEGEEESEGRGMKSGNAVLGVSTTRRTAFADWRASTRLKIERGACVRALLAVPKSRM